MPVTAAVAVSPGHRRLRTHAQGTFRFLVGVVHTPGPGLGVQIVPGTESASRKEVSFDKVKRPFHPGAAVGVANGMGNEFKAEDLPEDLHLRRDHRLLSTARDHHHIAVVDHAACGAAIHEAQRLTHKGLGPRSG